MPVIELQYFPQAAYIAQFLKYNELIIDAHENYVKQSYRNRCRILTANGVDQLSIPVIGSGKKIPTREIRIDHSQKWLNRHWRAIQSAYGRAPYFEYYADELERILRNKHEFLFELSRDLLTQCLEYLQFDIELNFSNNYVESPELDLRDLISLKSTKDARFSFNQQPYQQVFGNNFVGQLSVIDLIFCEGPRAGDLIRSGVN